MAEEEVSFGIELLPDDKPTKIAHLIKVAEDNGFEYAWICDHYNNYSYMGVLTLAAVITNKIRLGPGITNPYTRHPLVTASNIATLDWISGGRAVLGMGPGDKATFEKMGMPFPCKVPIWNFESEDEVGPATAIKEVKELIYEYLKGGPVEYEGEFVKTGTADVNARSIQGDKIPFYMGAQGPIMLKTAGEIADGVLVNASHPKDFEEAIPHIEEGAKEAGRSLDEIDVAAYTCFSIDKDEDKAIEETKIVVAFIVMGAPDVVLERHDIDKEKAEQIAEAIQKGDFGKAISLVDEDMIEAFSIAGDPDTVIDKIEELLKTGVTQVVVGSPIGPDKEKAIELIGEEVIPHFKE